MGISYKWADDSHMIMDLTLERPWTWAEYHTNTREVMTTLAATGKPCATTVDVRNIGPLPKDGNVLSILMGVEKQMPDNMFASVLVGAPYIVTVFMNMLMKLRPHATRMTLFTKTVEEAHAAIWERYRQIAPDSVSETKPVP